jgi:hypothetical protein
MERLFPTRAANRSLSWAVTIGDRVVTARQRTSLPAAWNEAFCNGVARGSHSVEAAFGIRYLPSPFSPHWASTAELGRCPSDRAAHYRREELRARRSSGVTEWIDTIEINLSTKGGLPEDLCEEVWQSFMMPGMFPEPFSAVGKAFPSPTAPELSIPPLQTVIAFTARNWKLLQTYLVGNFTPPFCYAREGLSAETRDFSPHETNGSRVVLVATRSDFDMSDPDWVRRSDGELVGGTAIFTRSVAERLRAERLLDLPSSGYEVHPFILEEFGRPDSAKELHEVEAHSAFFAHLRGKVTDELMGGKTVIKAHAEAYRQLGWKPDLVEHMRRRAETLQTTG